jgi:hypothetical protein
VHSFFSNYFKWKADVVKSREKIAITFMHSGLNQYHVTNTMSDAVDFSLKSITDGIAILKIKHYVILH